VHGAEEEIFFVLGGSGLLLQGGATCEVAQGDTIVHLPGKEPHALVGSPATSRTTRARARSPSAASS
jgi:uncharacterized cupin superfamily protein